MTRKRTSSTKAAKGAGSSEVRSNKKTIGPIKPRKSERSTVAVRPRKTAKKTKSAKPRKLEAIIVLVLQSVNDALTDGRIERAKRNPWLQRYRISHEFLIELSEAERSFSMEDMMMRVQRRGIDGDALFRRLDTQISELRPAFLVVHAGFVFQSAQEVVLDVLHRLKMRFNMLRFGLQSLYPLPSSHDELFEHGSEMDELIANLF